MHLERRLGRRRQSGSARATQVDDIISQCESLIRGVSVVSRDPSLLSSLSSLHLTKKEGGRGADRSCTHPQKPLAYGAEVDPRGMTPGFHARWHVTQAIALCGRLALKLLSLFLAGVLSPISLSGRDSDDGHSQVLSGNTSVDRESRSGIRVQCQMLIPAGPSSCSIRVSTHKPYRSTCPTTRPPTPPAPAPGAAQVSPGSP